MMYRTETKLQGWQAVAVLDDGVERLLCLGRSAPQVRAGYASACAELLDDAERAAVRRIALQRWQGAADQGRWCFEGVLPVPPRQAVADVA